VLFRSSDGRTAVWTGKEMLVWGGEAGDGDHSRPDDGAAYDASADSWTELPRSPYWSLAGHTAVWTGEEMVVWGGVVEAGVARHGAAFDPRSGVWRKIARPPIDGRSRHTAVWTGAEMIVWGGRRELPFATGAAYDPDSDSWRELPPAPISGRDLHAAVWTGEEMIVWGGWSEHTALSDGAAYDPVSTTWRELPRAPIRAPQLDTAAVWTGREMVVVGRDGELAAYSPGEDEWTRLPEPPGGAVNEPTLVAVEDGVILWGGTLTGDDDRSSEGAVLHLDS
jgi:hypothetical protein